MIDNNITILNNNINQKSSDTQETSAHSMNFLYLISVVIQSLLCKILLPQAKFKKNLQNIHLTIDDLCLIMMPIEYLANLSKGKDAKL